MIAQSSDEAALTVTCRRKAGCVLGVLCLQRRQVAGSADNLQAIKQAQRQYKDSHHDDESSP
jgi:hypothetical protein